MMQVGSRSEASGIAKAGAKMVMAVSCAKVGLRFFLVSYVQFISVHISRKCLAQKLPFLSSIEASPISFLDTIDNLKIDAAFEYNVDCQSLM